MLRTFFCAFVLLVCTAFSSFASAKTLIVAHDATWPPMEFTDENRQIVGYSVDYIDAIAKELGIEVKHINAAWDGIFNGLVSKKYDVISSSVTITEDRKKILAFTDPYYEVFQAVVAPKDVIIKSLSDLEGKQLGAQIGTTGYMAGKKTKGVKTVSYEEIGMAMAALASGRVDAVICDDATASNYILTNKDYEKTMHVALVVPAEEPEYYGFAIHKDNPELVEMFNKAIKAVKEKGIGEQLRVKWIK